MKQVAQAALGEQGIMIKLCMIINSVGNTVPVFSTFQEQDLMTLMFDTPPGSFVLVDSPQSSWIKVPVSLKVA
jgi:hypothetical protein